MTLETLLQVMDVVFVISGLQGIYSAISAIGLIERHTRAKEPRLWTQFRLWTQLMLLGISAVMLIAGLWHFFAA